MRGGAERVLRVLAALYPEAPIHTLLYDEARLGDWFPKERVRTSAVQKYAGVSTNHHLFLKRFPKAVEAWDFAGYDLVISSSSAFAHGIVTNGMPPHLCYVHSPARYLWDRTHDVMDRAARGVLGPLKRRHLSKTFHALRTWDSEAAERPDMLLSASETVRRRIELYWRRESDVLHPPLDDRWLEGKPASSDPRSRGYWLAVSTLADYKRIDAAIRACNARGERLVIAGTGPAEAALKKIAGKTVEFAGHVDGDALRSLYEGARGTIFPGDEDFGLVPLESMACGTPVVGIRAGGALETIRDGKTGVLAESSDPAHLEAAMDRLSAMDIDPAACAASVRTHTRAAFEKGIRHAADALVKRRA